MAENCCLEQFWSKVQACLSWIQYLVSKELYLRQRIKDYSLLWDKEEVPGWCQWNSYKVRMSACSVTQLYPPLCNPVDCSPPGSSVHGILQARILEWVAISSSRRASRPKDWTHVSCVSVALAGGFFTTEPSGKPKSGDSEEHKLWEWKEITPAKGRGPELHQHTLDLTEDVT